MTTAPASGTVLPAAAAEYFRLERIPVVGAATVDRGFSIVIVRYEEVAISGCTYRAGSTLLVPHAAGPLDATGVGELLVARPPAP